MASKVNTKFVVILVGSLLALAVGVGALAAYSLRMSGERNVAAGDELVAKAREAQAAGNEEQAIEYINDAASQYGRAVNKDRSRRDWLITWRDTLLQTNPETDIEYQRQFVQRYIGALDRLASLDPSDPAPQIEYFQVQEELQRVSGGAAALLRLEQDFDRRIESLEEGSPTRVRLQALQGLARTERASLENVDANEREEAVAWMDRFYNEFRADEEAFTTPPAGITDPNGFAEAARDDHARVALGLVQAVINERDVAQTEGRSQDAQERLGVALGVINTIMNADQQYATDLRFLILRTGIELERATTETVSPARQRAARMEVFAAARDDLFAALRRIDAGDVPLELMARLIGWYESDEDRAVLADQVERVVDNSTTQVRRLLSAGRVLVRLGHEKRALEVFDRIVDMPRPTLSIEGLLLADAKVMALSEQVQVNLSLRSEAMGLDEAADAQNYLDAAIQAREALAARAGVTARRLVLLADADIAIAQNETTPAIRLLEEFRREFGDAPEVLVDLANQLYVQGNLGEAKQLLERIIPAGRVNPFGIMVLSQIYERDGELDRALELLQVESRRSTTPEVFAAEIQRIQTLIDIQQGVSGADPVLAAIMRVDELMARRDFDAARQRIDELLDQVPEAADDQRVEERRIDIELGSGNTDVAIARLRSAIESYPDDARFERVLRRLTSEDPVALQLAEIDASDRPEIDKALLRYNLFSARGQTEEAEAEIVRAEQIDPDNPTVLDIRFSQAIDADELAEAARIAARAEESNADGVDGLLFLGRLQLARGEQSAAIRTLRTASEMIPSSIPIRRYLGSALLQAGQVDEGLDFLRRAYEARRDNIAVLLEYANALSRFGRAAEARTVLDPGTDPRAAARMNRGIANFWLSLEAQVGNASRALDERRTYFRADVQADALASSQSARTNATELIELLVNRGDVDEAEQVFAQAREHLDSRLIAQAEFLIAMGRAAAIEDAAEAERASLEALNSFRELAAEEAARTQEAEWLFDAARFAFADGRFDLGLEILRDAQQYESSEERSVSKQIAQRLRERAARLDGEALQLGAQAQQQEATDPMGAESLRERAAQASGRATVSRDEAVVIYEDLIASDVADEDGTIQLSLAELLLQTDRLDRAADIVQSVRSEQPNNLLATLLGAEIADRRGNATEAIRLYDLAVANNPTDYRAFLERARYFADDTARRADVLADLRRVNDLRPSVAEGWILRAQVLQQTGNLNAAFTVIEDGIAAAPSIADQLSQVLVRALVGNDRANEAYAIASARAEAEPESVLWQSTSGDLASARGAWTDAIRHFERLIQIPAVIEEPRDHGQAATRLLNAKLQARQTIDVAEIDRLAELTSQLGFEGRGGVARAMLLARAYATIPSERERASNLIRQAYLVASEPGEDATPSQKIAVWFANLPLIVGGDRQAFDYVLDVDELIRSQRQSGVSDIPHPLYLRVLALRAAAVQGQSPTELIERGNAMFEEAEADQLARYELLKQMSRLYTRIEDYEAATRYGRDALELNPNDAEMLNNVAFFLAKYLDRAQEALPLAKRAAEMSPEDADVLDTVGTVYLASGDVDEAISYFEQSLRFAGDARQRVTANIHLAEALIAGGDKTNAERHLRDAERELPVVNEATRNVYGPELTRVRQLLGGP